MYIQSCLQPRGYAGIYIVVRRLSVTSIACLHSLSTPQNISVGKDCLEQRTAMRATTIPSALLAIYSSNMPTAAGLQIRRNRHRPISKRSVRDALPQTTEREGERDFNRPTGRLDRKRNEKHTKTESIEEERAAGTHNRAGKTERYIAIQRNRESERCHGR